MQTQVVHQPKASIPWIPALIAALIVFATVAAIQVAFRDRGTTAPSVSVVEGPGIRGVGEHGAARIASDEGTKAAMQKAGMVEAGVTSLAWGGDEPVVTGGPHPRTKFGGKVDEGPRDAALRATITRLRDG